MGDALGDEFGLDVAERDKKVEFADVGFDANFPEGHDADENRWGGFDAVTGGCGEFWVVFEEPEDCMGVEEEGHLHVVLEFF